ncbi:SGNH/GDSL hydrolase family protein, partial [Alienimonas sp. DA493]|uniref:SGNH/GDSL hydrolase family protein n=1 Tax=Alienimonas sp. DA493 TaxID=3373605 RepID=UPI003754AD0B
GTLPFPEGRSMIPLLIALLSVAPAAGGGSEEDPAWLHVRGGLPWTHVMLEKRGAVRVVFLGGSITEGAGYRPLVEQGLRERYPQVEWTFVNAGISSTGSTTGVFRARDAISVDGRAAAGVTLLIAEAAVNDDQDEKLPAGEAGWGMEGVARMPAGPPSSAILERMFVHFPNPAIVEKLRSGEDPISVAAHEAVAERYDIPSVNVAAEVARRIDEGTLTWEQYGGTHPGPVGHQLAADMILEAIARSTVPQRRGERDRVARRRRNLEKRDVPEAGPLRPDAVDRAELRAPAALGEGITVGDGWQTGQPDWDALPGSSRSRFERDPLLYTTDPGATLTFDPAAAPFTALGLFVLAGPDAGAVEVSVPGEEPKTVQLYHEHSKGLHYPRTVLLYRSDKPPAGPVTAKVVKGDRGGTAVRIVGVGLGFITRNRADAASR